MFSFKEILEELSLPPKIKKNIIALEIAQKNWEKVISKNFLNKTKPLFFNDDTLFIEVPNHYYLQIISSLTLEILEKLENVTPENLRPLFKNLKFIINPSLEKETKYQQISTDLPKMRITFEKICKNLKDKELKHLFSKLFKSYLNTKIKDGSFKNY